MNYARGPDEISSTRRLAQWVMRFEWLWILLIAPFLLFPGSMRFLALLAVPILWFGRKVAWGRFVDRTPLDAPLVLLMLMVLVSLYATFDIAYSLPKVTGVILGVAVYYVVIAFARDRKTWTLMVAAFLLAALGVAGAGLLGTQWIHKFALFDPILARLPARITGLSGAAEGFQPNEVAGALLWATPLACALASVAVFAAGTIGRSLGRARQVILLVATVVGSVFLVGVLVLTQSRGGWIAAGLILPLTLLVLLQGRLRWIILIMGVIALIAAAVWIGLAHPHVLDPVIVGPEVDPGRGTSLENLSVRFEIWSRAIYGIEDFPLTGMGMNAFRRVVPILYPLFSIGPEVDIAHAHNEFLQAGVDLGIPGLIAFLSIHLTAFSMLASTWRRRGLLPFPEPIIRALLLGLGAGLAAHLLFGVTDAVALGAKPGVLWWILLGLIASLYRRIPQTATQMGI